MKRLFQQTKTIITVCITVVVISTPLIAQDHHSSEDWNKAQAEMKAMFGAVPIMFTKLPMHVRTSAWEWFKAISNPQASIPPKYGELIGLAVASQIPCEYCVYAHTSMAKMLGATDQEIQEAVVKGAEVRHWSTILNGNQVSYESFKADWDAILAFVKANSGSK
jgi:AhpD family alkylhydroperoxidase